MATQLGAGADPQPQIPNQKTVRLFGPVLFRTPNGHTPSPSPKKAWGGIKNRYATYARKPKKGVKMYQRLTKALFCVSRGSLKWVCELRKILPLKCEMFINDLQKQCLYKSLAINQMIRFLKEGSCHA